MTLFNKDGFDSYAVRLATDDDTRFVCELLRSTAKWLRDKGVNQWGYLLEPGMEREITQGITSGHTYIVETGNKTIAGTFNLSAIPSVWDIDVWDSHVDNAFYLHRLAVHRDFSGLGRQLLTFINEATCIHDGSVRLDCVADNAFLNQYYQDAGFTFMGYQKKPEGQFSKYERHMAKT